MTLPSDMSMTSSASIKVVRRCAIIRVVRPRASSDNAAWTSRSVSLSSALVASSRMRIRGLRKMVRAMAIR